MQEQGISVLNKAIAACAEAIEQHKGKLVVKEPPRAVSVFFLFKHLVKLWLVQNTGTQNL